MTRYVQSKLFNGKVRTETESRCSAKTDTKLDKAQQCIPEQANHWYRGYCAPFHDERLNFISTDKVISEDLAGSVLQLRHSVKQWYEEFKTGSFAYGERFVKRYPKDR